MKLLRIVPVEHTAHDYCVTRGTKVLTPEGEEVQGVTSIKLHADLNDIWRAEISLIIDPPEVTALEDREFSRFLSEHEVARLKQLEAERNAIIGRQIPIEREVIDFRKEYAA